MDSWDDNDTSDAASSIDTPDLDSDDDSSDEMPNVHEYPGEELSDQQEVRVQAILAAHPATQQAWSDKVEPFLRDYQREGVKRTLLYWDEHPAQPFPALSLPTGSGKSEVTPSTLLVSCLVYPLHQKPQSPWFICLQVSAALSVLAPAIVPTQDCGSNRTQPRVLLLAPTDRIKEGLLTKTRKMFTRMNPGTDGLQEVVELHARPGADNALGTARFVTDSKILR